MKITRRQLRRLISESSDRSYNMMYKDSPMPMKSRADAEFAELVKGESVSHSASEDLGVDMLRKIIHEELSNIDESSADWISVNKPVDVQKAIKDIYGRIVDLEDSIELMGGDVISWKQNMSDIEAANSEPNYASIANTKNNK